MILNTCLNAFKQVALKVQNCKGQIYINCTSQFQNFAQSVLFCNKSQTQRIFNLLQKLHPNYTKSQLTKQCLEKSRHFKYVNLAPLVSCWQTKNCSPLNSPYDRGWTGKIQEIDNYCVLTTFNFWGNWNVVRVIIRSQVKRLWSAKQVLCYYVTRYTLGGIFMHSMYGLCDQLFSAYRTPVYFFKFLYVLV